MWRLVDWHHQWLIGNNASGVESSPEVHPRRVGRQWARVERAWGRQCESARRHIEAHSHKLWVSRHNVESAGAGTTVLCFHLSTCSFVVEEHTIPGRLKSDQVLARGLPPGPLYRKLKNGESVPLPNGEILHAHEVSR